MITELTTYITENTVPYQNLALEEYLTFHTHPGECILYLWQNRHTVVIGKNQNCWKECKVNHLEADGGYLARRLSGGGAVFHDLGNLNFTFCVRREDYNVERQLQVIIEAVRMLGMEAEKTGRNDIVIKGKKFSGNAFFESGDFCYHHGTILLDVDKENMSRYLNVSKEKLQSKGVNSVRSRVANLTEFNPDVTVALMKQKLVQAFGLVYGIEPKPLSGERIDREEISRSEKRFASWEWKYGRKISFQYSMNRRFSWGDVELQIEVDRGIVKAVNAFSDGMEQELIAALPEAMSGCRYEETELVEAVQNMPGESEILQKMKQDIAGLIHDSL